MIKKLFKKFWNYGNDYTLGLGKELFLGLLIFLGILFINFSSAGSYTYTGYQDFTISRSTSTSNGYLYLTLPIPVTSFIYTPIYEQVSNISCDFSIYNNPGNIIINFLDISINKATGGQNSISNDGVPWNGLSYSFPVELTYESPINYTNIVFQYARPVSSATSMTIGFSCTFSGDNIINQSDLNYTCPECPSCDYSGYVLESDVTENYCTDKFDYLIDEDNINQNYCESNGLCPIVSGTGNWSALYINDIQRNSAGIIDITIPEEIQWDYSNQNDLFELDIEGYNVDTEYIEGVINTQSTLPNQVDLNNLVSSVLPLFVPGLVIILFIYFVFKFIKKIF